YLDAASGAGGFDHVLTGGAAAGVHQNLNEISLCHTTSLFPIRIELMRYQRVAQPPPEAHSVEQLKEAAASCQACDLWREATQTVFGEGAEHARMMLVGEQPGDQEDLQGKPFVGPAGRLLERALDEAEIDRRRVYVTKAVKHFWWTRRGKRRLHEKPNAAEVQGCLPWRGAAAAHAPERVSRALSRDPARLEVERRPARSHRPQPRHAEQPGARPRMRPWWRGRGVLARGRPGRGARSGFAFPNRRSRPGHAGDPRRGREPALRR